MLKIFWGCNFQIIRLKNGLAWGDNGCAPIAFAMLTDALKLRLLEHNELQTVGHVTRARVKR